MTRCFRWSPAPATACRSWRWLFAKPVEVQITGSILTYEHRRSRRGLRRDGKTLAAPSRICADFIRRVIDATPSRASAFPMWWSIQWLDRVPRAKRLAAAKPTRAERFSQGAWSIAGGTPSQPTTSTSRRFPAERPSRRLPISPIWPPGEIIQGRASQNKGGAQSHQAIPRYAFRAEPKTNRGTS